MTSVLRSAVRGLALGILAGIVWAAIEAAVHWAAGSLIPVEVFAQMAALDVAFAAAGGLVLGLALPTAGLGILALGLAATYGFVRVGPGIRAELVFIPIAAAAVWLGRRITGRDADGLVGFLHLVVLGTVALLLAEIWLNESHAVAPPKGVAFLAETAALPLAAVVVDRILAFALRPRVLRFGAELALCAVAALVWNRAVSAAPQRDPLVTGVPPGAGAPDIFLLTIDTTRADHLSTYGYTRETSPNLTKFAADALLFENAHSTVGWTLPSHASILTGLYPSRHGARAAGGAWLAGQSIDGRRNVARPLAEDRTTLAEVLRDRGYHTGGFVANFSYLYRQFGFSQGFQIYQDNPWLLFRLRPPAVRFARALWPRLWLRPYVTGRGINASALAWLDSTSRDRPAFVWMNYMEAHPPWLATPPHDHWASGLPDAHELATEDLYTHEVRHYTPAQRDFIVANYDGGLEAADDALGNWIDELKARGRYENALIIVTADHGTLLGDHDQVGHIGRMLYEPLLHVPLVVKFPGKDHPRGRITSPAQTLDVFATAVAAAGATPPPEMQGQALPAITHPIMAEDEINAYLVSCCGAVYDRAVRVLIDGPEKLITTSKGDRMLFRIDQDPGETHNEASTEPQRVDTMAQVLRTLLPFQSPGPAVATPAAPPRPREPAG